VPVSPLRSTNLKNEEQIIDHLENGFVTMLACMTIQESRGSREDSVTARR